MAIDEQSKQILKERFAKELKDEVKILVFTNKNETKEFNKQAADFTKEIVEDMKPLSDKLIFEMHDLSEDIAKQYDVRSSPTLLIQPDKYKIYYTGAPLGHEFGGFVDTIIMVSQQDSGLSESIKEQLNHVTKDVLMQVFITPTCPYCPKAVVTANKFAIENPKIKAECVEATENPELANQFGVSAVPHTVINENKDNSIIGALPESKFADAVLKVGAENYEEIKAAAKQTVLPDNPDKPVIVDDESFEDAIKKYPKIVVDCWAEWCGPCKMIGPIVEELAKEMQGNVVFAKLNVDENQETAGKYGIMSIPTLLVFKEGQLVDQIVGAMPKEALKEKVMKNF